MEEKKLNYVIINGNHQGMWAFLIHAIVFVKCAVVDGFSSD